MKKNFTLCLVFTLVALGAKAQSLIPVPANDSMWISDANTDQFSPTNVHIEVVNNSAAPITITWGMISYTGPSSWGIGLCDNNNCYDMVLLPRPHTSLPVLAHDTMDFKFLFTAACISGTGSAYVYAYVTGDSANTVIHPNFSATVSSVCTQINEISPLNLKLYPNPASNSFLVSGLENAGNVSFEIYDMKGAAVNPVIKDAGNAQFEISVQNLPKGEYILKAFDANNKLVGTSRLQKVD